MKVKDKKYIDMTIDEIESCENDIDYLEKNYMVGDKRLNVLKRKVHLLYEIIKIKREEIE